MRKLIMLVVLLAVTSIAIAEEEKPLSNEKIGIRYTEILLTMRADCLDECLARSPISKDKLTKCKVSCSEKVSWEKSKDEVLRKAANSPK